MLCGYVHASRGCEAGYMQANQSGYAPGGAHKARYFRLDCVASHGHPTEMCCFLAVAHRWSATAVVGAPLCLPEAPERLITNAQRLPCQHTWALLSSVSSAATFFDPTCIH